GGDEAAEVAPPGYETLEGHRHLAHRRAAIAREHGALALRMMPRHLARVDHRGRRLPGGREIHRDRANPKLLQAVAQEVQLSALGVERARDVRGAADGGGYRQLHDPRRA